MMLDYTKSSKQLAIDLINQAIEVKVGIKDVELTDITYLEEGYYNTRAVLKPALGSTWQEPVTIEYDRINMAYFFRGIPVSIEPNYQRTIGDLLPVINNLYSLSLTKEDIIDGVIPENTLPPYTIEVKINPTNPAFYGTFRVTVTNEDKSLKKKLSGLKLGGIKYLTGDTTKIQGPLYLRTIDFSENKLTLESYSKGSTIDNTLVDLLNYYVEDGWVNVNEKCDYNLFGSEIVHNGYNVKFLGYVTNRHYPHVMIIKLNEDYNTNVSGYLTLHYNYYND